MKYIVTVQDVAGIWQDKLTKTYVYANTALRYAEKMLHAHRAVKIETKDDEK